MRSLTRAWLWVEIRLSAPGDDDDVEVEVDVDVDFGLDFSFLAAGGRGGLMELRRVYVDTPVVQYP